MLDDEELLELFELLSLRAIPLTGRTPNGEQSKRLSRLTDIFNKLHDRHNACIQQAN